MSRTSAHLIQPHLNYWMNNMPKAALKFLTVGDLAVAMTKAAVSPISNMKLLETVVGAIHSLYGTDTEIKADFKFHHDLRLTQFRLILPEKARTMKTARSDEDKWSIGLDFQNSLTAEAALRHRGYLFAWEGSNGAISTHASSGVWSRKGSPSEDQALEWTTAAIEGVLENLEHELDNVEALNKLSIEGEANDTLIDVFEKYKVPTASRELIITELIDADDLTFYGVMKAISGAANVSTLAPSVVSKLMEIAGDLPSSATGLCAHCHRLPIN